jgi:hypothetical protein
MRKLCQVFIIIHYHIKQAAQLLLSERKLEGSPNSFLVEVEDNDRNL